jgi:tRNA(Ile)-lysidine synthase
MAWREDASNSDTVYLRNRIRHQLLPLLEEYNPAIRERLAATAAILGDDDAALAEVTERAYAESCRAEEGRVVCSILCLRLLHSALLRRVLRHAFRQLTGTLAEVSLRHIGALEALIDSARPNAELSLPQGVKGVREYETLLLLQGDVTPVTGGYKFLISVPGRYLLPDGTSLKVEMADAAVFPSDSRTLFCNPVLTPFPWLVRTFQSGDRMTPFGMKGRKMVKDIFIDRKIPLPERRRIPLLFCGDELIWIAGVCASEVGRINDSTSAVIRVVWE